jgi:hypothetical protein
VLCHDDAASKSLRERPSGRLAERGLVVRYDFFVAHASADAAMSERLLRSGAFHREP